VAGPRHASTSFPKSAYVTPASSSCPRERVIQSARKPSAAPCLGTAQADGIFPAARENTGKNPVGAQNRPGSSQIDPSNQVLIGSFPMRLAGKECSLPRMPAGKWQGSQKERRLGAWCRAARPAPLPLLAGNVAGLPARPRCRPHRSPLLVLRRRFATVAQIIRVNLDAKMAGSSSPRRRRRSGLFPRLITASKAGIQSVMLRMLSWSPSCARVTINPMRCPCDIRGFTQCATRTVGSDRRERCGEGRIAGCRHRPPIRCESGRPGRAG
jgi:hypothetical protein